MPGGAPWAVMEIIIVLKNPEDIFNTVPDDKRSENSVIFTLKSSHEVPRGCPN